MTGYEFAEWPIERIHVGERLRQDLGDIAALAASIKDVGLLQPLVVLEDGTLVAGHRRLAAIQNVLKWATVPVSVRRGDGS